jgi:hypothetical protein
MSERILNDDDVIAQQQVIYSPDELITVGQFADPATAQLVKSELEANDIPVFLQGENANSLLPVAFEARIQVRPQDELEAREVVRQLEIAPDSAEAIAAGDTGMYEESVEDYGHPAAVAGDLLDSEEPR